MTAGSITAPFIIPIRVPPPGKAKHEIDTSTPVEIKSDSPDVSVFYTLDGSKPEVLRRPEVRGSSTMTYSEPIYLPSGKVSVRALAVTSDGRQSAVVTKVFVVEQIPSELQDYEENHQTSTLLLVNVYNCVCLFKSTAAVESILKNLTSTQKSRIQLETDFLRCTTCLSHRPSDPFARFCLHCGAPVPPIPGQRLPPTEGGRMMLCVQCKSMVPANTSSCVVCEVPLAPQLQPQASLRLQDKLICQSCGTGNPAHITYCVTCETRLPQIDKTLSRSAPPLPCTEGKMVSCPKCKRVNHSDARFCDWCGAKPGHVRSLVRCSHCGLFLEGPPRPPPRTTQPVSSSVLDVVAGSVAERLDAQTQTTGIFYPSTTDLQRRSQRREEELNRQEKMSDRKPLLTAISPGRGYWRKQLDHICAHLRSYTQNNSEFRALIGEPRMGRLVSVVIEEDSYEVSLRINFISAAPQRPTSCATGQMNGSVYEGHSLSAVTEGRATRATSLSSIGTLQHTHTHIYIFLYLKKIEYH
uniref:Double zinc ribbon and ankyrin repeat domains 1 n=1 Tax=Astyanax mexicanus TaxID=7994 RepID=W5KB97_ASTMX